MGKVIVLPVARRNGAEVDRQTRERAEEVDALRRIRPKGPPVRRRRAPTRRFGDEEEDDGPAEPLGPGDEPGK